MPASQGAISAAIILPAMGAFLNWLPLEPHAM